MSIQKTIWIAVGCPLMGVVVTLLPISQAKAVEPIYTTWYSEIAIKGYDPVAYFTSGKAIKGKPKFTIKWRGAIWQFSNAKHRQLFFKAPEQYAPQYGGYCAYAVANNTTAGVDPEKFILHEGRLYLNYNAKINRKWREGMEWYIKQADQNWPHMVEE